MKHYLSGALKVLISYGIALILFGVFLFTVISLSGDNFGFWLGIYSFIMFLLMGTMVYSDMKRQAIKEMRPQYDLHPYPLKGLVYGLIGIIPLAVLEAVYPFVKFGDPIYDRMVHLILNTLLGPVYIIVKLLNETAIGYISAILAVAVLAMLGYLAGYYKFDLGFKSKKKTK